MIRKWLYHCRMIIDILILSKAKRKLCNYAYVCHMCTTEVCATHVEKCHKCVKVCMSHLCRSVSHVSRSMCYTCIEVCHTCIEVCQTCI